MLKSFKFEGLPKIIRLWILLFCKFKIHAQKFWLRSFNEWSCYFWKDISNFVLHTLIIVLLILLLSFNGWKSNR